MLYKFHLSHDDIEILGEAEEVSWVPALCRVGWAKYVEVMSLLCSAVFVAVTVARGSGVRSFLSHSFNNIS